MRRINRNADSEYMRVRIYVVPRYKSNSVRVFFEVTNKTSRKLKVFKQNTPLEGLVSDCLNVRVNGKKVSYDGKHVKRVSSHDDFVALLPGQSKSHEIDISEAYSLSQRGNVTVTFKKANLVTISDDNVQVPINLITSPAKFTITKLYRPTIGERYRRPEHVTNSVSRSPRSITLTADAVNAPQPPNIEDVRDSEQRNILLRVHAESFNACLSAMKSLEQNDNRRYTQWFGPYNVTRAGDVYTVFERIVKRMEETTFSYIYNTEGCSGNIAAFTTEGSDTIFFCELFWTLLEEGTESQVGCLVHEHSHASAGTDDYGKGTGPGYYSQFAQTNAVLAVKCAYNIEYFAVYEDQIV